VGLVAEADVVDVDEDLVLALLVPDLVPDVAGVVEDRSDGLSTATRSAAVEV
jgi:hypothetical protein